jgi:DNA-binding transcriptional LysR family regulator
LYLEQLRYFLEVANRQSMSLAAESLFVTPQNISKSIRQLEEELETPLFRRTKHGMFLTKNGQIVYDTAKDVIEKCDTLSHLFLISDQFAAEDMDLQGEVTIFSTYLMEDALNHIIAQLRKKYPGIKVFLHVSDPSEAAVLVNDERPNLFFFNINNSTLYQQFSAEYELFALEQEPISLIIRKDHELALEKDISFGQLASVPIAIHETSFGKNFLQKIIEERFIKLNVQIKTNSYHSIINAVLSGECGMLGLPSMLDNMSPIIKDQLCCKPMHENIPVKSGLFVLKTVVNIPIYQAVIRAFADFYQDRQFFRVRDDRHAI